MSENQSILFDEFSEFMDSDQTEKMICRYHKRPDSVAQIALGIVRDLQDEGLVSIVTTVTASGVICHKARKVV